MHNNLHVVEGGVVKSIEDFWLTIVKLPPNE
jgi:hypothetical protein